MAARNYVTLEGSKYKRRPSDTDTVDFTSVRIGGSNLAISETGGALDVGGVRVTNGATPTASSDLVTKSYADSIAGGFDPKESCKYATTAALPAVTAAGSGVGKTLTADANGALSVDGAAPIVGNRILVKNQAAGADNGVYTVTATGDGSNPFILTRATDFDQDVEVTNGARTLVTAGTANVGIAYFVLTSDPITVDTTAIVWSEAAGSVPTATSGSGGATQGTVSADSDKGLSITAGVMEVTVEAAGAIEFGGAGALQINLEASDPSLQISANELGVKLNGSGAITKGAAGVGINVGDGVEINANALKAKSGDATILVDANGISVDFTEAKVNDNAGTVAIRDFVFIKADGDVDLAQANGTFDLGTKFGCAKAAILTTATGDVYLRPGARIAGFSSLVPLSPVYLSRTTAGGFTQSLTGFVAGEHVIRVGYAITADILEFDPSYIIEY